MATYNGHNEDASGNILLSIGNGMTATVETGTKASQAYTKGSYLYYNNRLCKATAAIASNATLTIGTNIAYTSLGAELTSHLRASDGNEFYFDYKDGKPGYYPTASKTASQFVPFGGSDVNFSGIVSIKHASGVDLCLWSKVGVSKVSFRLMTGNSSNNVMLYTGIKNGISNVVCKGATITYDNNVGNAYLKGLSVETDHVATFTVAATTSVALRMNSTNKFLSKCIFE